MTKKLPDVRCKSCQKSLRNVQPSRALIKHVLSCPTIPDHEKLEWMSGAKESSHGQPRAKESSHDHQKNKRMRMSAPAGVREFVDVNQDEQDDDRIHLSMPFVGPIEKDVEDEYQRVIARAFYAAVWSFQSVEREEVKDMLRFFAKDVKLSTRHDLGGPLLASTGNGDRVTIEHESRLQVVHVVQLHAAVPTF